MADIGRSGWRNVGSSMPCPGRLVAIAATQRSAISLVGRPRAQRGAQVGLLAGEQAVAHLAVRGQPDPVAVAAERPGHRGDDADRGGSAVDEEQLGRGAPPRLGGGAEHELLLQAGEDLVGGDHLGPAPAVLRVERHLLDEPQVVAPVEAPAQQLGGLVVVVAAQQDGVDLDRTEPGLRGRRQPRDDVVQPVASGDGVEGLRPHAVEADVDPVQPGGLAGRGRCGPGRARWWSSRSRGRARRRGVPATMSTRPRRTSGSPPVKRTSSDPEQVHRDVDEADDLASVSTLSSGSQSRPSAGMQ